MVTDKLKLMDSGDNSKLGVIKSLNNLIYANSVPIYQSLAGHRPEFR